VNLDGMLTELTENDASRAYPVSDVAIGSGGRWVFIRDNEGS